MKHIYDEDPYPEVIIEINEEKMLELYDKVKEKSKCPTMEKLA